MSIYNDKYDSALSKASWVSKSVGGKPYLFKYAPHPDRAGYLFVATDLETVLFEALTATAIPTRLSDVATRLNDFDAPEAGSLSLEDEQRQSEETLQRLAEIFDGGLSSASISAERDDYYDLVLIVRSPSFNWQFNLTEMRGRQPLTFLARQILAPFASLIAEDRGVLVTDTPAEAVSTVVSDPGVARALRRISGAPPPHPSQPRSRIGTAPVSPAPTTPTPRRASPPRTKSPDATPRPVTPVRPSGLTRTNNPPPSPTPLKQAHKPLVSSSSSRAASPSEQVQRHRQAVMTDFTIPPSSPPRAAPSSDASEIPTSSDLPSSQMPSSTQDPLLPSDADRPRRKRKKDKEAEAAAEEAEADKRRAEMKRKMAAGAKKPGAGLGRRRF